MPRKNVSMEEGLQMLLRDILAKRRVLLETLDACSKDPALCSLLPTLKAMGAKLDRITTVLNWVIEAGLAKDPDGDPRLLDQIHAAQRHLLGLASRALSEAMEDLLADDWERGAPAN
jgi:hypothetical protein